MGKDWKDALAGLMTAGEIPDGAEPENDPSVEIKEEVSASKKQSEALNIVFERKGRGGKSATIIEGFTLPEDEVSHIARELRRALGTGGSSRGGEILLQGECRQKAAERLRALGFKVKGVK